MAGRMIKVISTRFQQETNENYLNRTQGIKNIKYWKRKIRVREPPKFEHVQSNYWTQNISFYLYYMILGNGVDSLPQSLRFALNVSGGVYILYEIIFTVLFILPVLYVEMFLGRYTGLSNGQMYRMSPIFFGMCIVGLILDAFYVSFLSPDVSMPLIGTLKLLLYPIPSCPQNGACYDYKKSGPLNGTCKYTHTMLNCTQRQEPVTYLMNYSLWKDFRKVDNFTAIWQLIIATLFTWVVILFIVNLRMKILQLILKISIIVNSVIMTVIFVMALCSKGSVQGLIHMAEFKIKQISLHSVILTGFFIPMKHTVVFGGGFMTYAANMNFRANIGMAANAVLLGMTNIFYNFYMLMILHAILGVLGTVIGLKSEDTYVPFIGLYYATIPEFLRYRDCPNIFAVMYYLSTWILECVKMTLMIRMQILSLCDIFPKIVQFQTHTKITYVTIQAIVGLTSTLGICVRVINNLNWVTNLYAMSPFLLILKGMLLFYVYGVRRLNDDIHFYTGKPPVKLWRFLWYLYPFILILFWGILILNFLEPYYQVNNFVSIDLVENEFSKHSLYIAIVKMGICLIGMFFISFLYIVFLIKSSKRINLTTPLFFWGPHSKTERVARKGFKPWKAIRSKQPKKERNRFRENSIKQQHERDMAGRKLKGRVFLDVDFFDNIGGKMKNAVTTSTKTTKNTSKMYELYFDRASEIRVRE